MDIEEIKRLNEARTQGEWHCQEKFGGGFYGSIYAFHNALEAGDPVIDEDFPLQDMDAAFIALAPQMADRIISDAEKIERLREGLSMAITWIESGHEITGKQMRDKYKGLLEDKS